MKPRKTGSVVTLNKKTVESLELPEDTFKNVWDANLNGFGIRVSPKGTKTYFIVYRNRYREQVRETIGRHGVISAVEARRQAKKRLGAVAAEAEPYRYRQAPKFEVIAEDYIKRRCSQKKSGREDERIILKDLMPRIGHMRVDNISRNDLTNIGYEIMDQRNSPVMANRTIEVASRVFNYGIKRGLVDSNFNPAYRAEKPYPEPRGRTRVLNENEIKMFWRITEILSSTSPQTSTALRLILVTAQRPGEITAMEWSNINMEEGIWILPGVKTKNKHEHLVPLSTLTKKLLHAVPRSGKYVFPSPLNLRGDIETHIKTNALALTARRIRKRKEFENLDHWTPHDLRRTAASHIGRLGFSLVVSKILNHLPRNITETIYNLYDYREEKREALEQWGKDIERIVIDSKKGKVLPLKV
jgi:integrase